MLEKVPENYRSEKICKQAVKENYKALVHVPNELKTKEIYIEAMKSSYDRADREVWNLIPENLRKDDEVCRVAIEQGYPVKTVLPGPSWQNASDNMYITAIKVNPDNYKILPAVKKTDEAFNIIAIRNGVLLTSIPMANRTEAVCREAVKLSGMSLTAVPSQFQTKEICMLAAASNQLALDLVNDAEIKKEITDQLDADQKANKSNIVPKIGITVDKSISAFSAVNMSQALSEISEKHNNNVGFFQEGMSYINDNSDRDHEAQIKKLVDIFFKKYDGLAIPGNSNMINENYYKENPKNIELSGPEAKNDRRTKLELALVRGAIERGVPVLGICGGNQVINVALGGQLDDLGGSAVQAQFDDVVYLGETQLQSVTKSNKKTDNTKNVTQSEFSYHQQAISEDHLPELLKVAARGKVKTDVQVIKAVEIKGHHPWVIGTQFHPESEFNPGSDKPRPRQSLELFKSFVDTCRDVKKQQKYKAYLLKEFEAKKEIKISGKQKDREAAVQKLEAKLEANQQKDFLLSHSILRGGGASNTTDNVKNVSTVVENKPQSGEAIKKKQ
jgi:putative glutamine amidotransferase